MACVRVFIWQDFQLLLGQLLIPIFDISKLLPYETSSIISCSSQRAPLSFSLYGHRLCSVYTKNLESLVRLLCMYVCMYAHTDGPLHITV